jgi:hypothetical protein
MILAREPFGKLPRIAENSLVGPTRRYYLIRDLVRRSCGPRSQEAFQRHRLVKMVFVLHLEVSGLRRGCTSGLRQVLDGLFCAVN